MSDKEILDTSFLNEAPNTSPFLSYEMVTLNDQSSGANYSSGQVVFETITLSNNGKWCDYRNGYLTIPCVFVVSGRTTANQQIADTNFEGANIKESDLLIGFKNSNINLINSISIDYGNQQLTQATDYVNMYLVYKQHETFSEQDEYLNGPTIGYAKDSSDGWTYLATANIGIANNNNANPVGTPLRNPTGVNTGLRKRQSIFKNIDTYANSNQELLLGLTADDRGKTFKSAGESYVKGFTTHKVWYYNAIIRLKDLPVFDKLPLMLGANFRINLTLNQCIFVVKKTVAGELTFDQTSFTGKNTNFLMVTDSLNNTTVPADDETVAPVQLRGGSWTIPKNTDLTISCSVGKCNYSTHSNLAEVSAHNTNVQLHIPVVQLHPSDDSRLLALEQKKIVYNEILSFTQLGVEENFNFLITNGVPNLKRLIIIPILNTTANAGVNPLLSPFSTEPSTCSPYKIQNLQVKIANHNIYPNPVNYSYEQFLQEINGKYSVGHNLETGQAGSMISLQDYINIYGYIVVDLKRKYTQDEAVPLSIHISGNIVSKKKLDFYMFVETEKHFTYNVRTGQRIS